MRLDLLLVERGLASTRSKAQELIRAGKVRLNGAVVTKAGAATDGEAKLELLEPEHPYVSRGGVKLAAALDAFAWRVDGARVLDLGQSTGGFTHCLLLRGARAVVGVEVGHGQLAPLLAADPRVKCLERTDIRTLSASDIAPPFSFLVADLSFISLGLVLPHLPQFLAPAARLLLLVKPQFELTPADLGSGGIVRSEERRLAALQKVEALCSLSGFTVAGKMDSPLTGGDGNQEYFLHLVHGAK